MGYDRLVARITLVALAWLLPAAAAAQYHVAKLEPSTGELRCDEIRPVYSSCPGCASPTTCREVDSGRWLCAEEDALFCIPDASMSAGTCPLGATRELTLPGGLVLCVRAGISVCSTPDPLACFRPPAGGGPVRYEAGDCDRDGLENRDDPAPCTRWPRLAVAGAGGACTAIEPCVVDSDCAPPFDRCEPVSGGEPHRYCLPDDDVAFCCGGFIGLACPDGPCGTIATPDDYGFCEDPRYCGGLGWEFSRRVACIEGEDGFPVTPDEGDCDGDGVRNDDDPAPCVPRMNVDAGVPDAGAPPGEDGGAAPADAGAPPGEDGGAAPMDAGAPPVEPRFGGGGGCRCDAVAPGAPALWPLLLVAAALLRRRI